MDAQQVVDAVYPAVAYATRYPDRGIVCFQWRCGCQTQYEYPLTESSVPEIAAERPVHERHPTHPDFRADALDIR